MDRPPFRILLHRFLGLLFLWAYVAWPSPGSPREPYHRTGGASLDQHIARILARTEMRRGFWGIGVVEGGREKFLYARDSDHLFLPASNMKLFTTAAALEKLGPDFVFRTTVEADQAPDSVGRVADLRLVGRGDPNLGSRVLPYEGNGRRNVPADLVFQQLADQVKAAGVREVSGNLIADDSYFLYEPYSFDWSVDDLQWAYGAPVTALAFNDNSLQLHFAAGAARGDRARVWLDPAPDYYRLLNRLETSAPGTMKRIFVERAPGSMDLDVWGQIPLGSEEDGDRVAIANPPELAGQIFRRALEARGITVRGEVRVQHLKRSEAAASADPFAPSRPRVVLGEHRSRPLREEIVLINKTSLNLHAEMLLRTMARELRNYGSLTVGLEVLLDFVTQAGIPSGETRFADGSGLSRETLVTPRAIVALLDYMSRSPRFEAFFDSLPVAGLDGTLAERFKGTVAEGRIHAKTGSIEHTSSLSGYMDLPSRKRLAFSVMINNHPLKSREASAVIDQIVLEIYRHFSAPNRAATKRAGAAASLPKSP
jgi:D-alanyl-D-alanine carboxypeptidase/D-alanyl-D-alanine-endopeptidase (penicillin-binding protein 4)